MIAKFRVINRAFTFLLAARILFTAGMRMTPVLLGWYLYELTGSKLSLGIVGLSEVLPAIFFALPAGVKVDTSDKHKLIRRFQLAYVLLMLLFSFTAGRFFGLLEVSDKGIEYLIYGIVGFTGFLRAYISPAYTAFLAQLVTKDQLVRAASTNSMSWLLAAIIGPTIAGLMVGFISVSSCFIVVATLILLANIVFRQIEPKPIQYNKGSTKTWHSVLEGLTFLRKEKALLGAMSLDMFAVLFGGAIALLPVFAKDILDAGPQIFGVLMSATYLGNFLAILYLTKYPLKGGQGFKLIYSIIGFGVCIVLFALSKNWMLSFIALFIGGLFDGVSVIIRSTIFQLFVPDQMRGRVSSVNSIFISSSNELGQFESGVAASIMGTVPSVIFGGTMTILIGLYAKIKIPSLRKLEY